MFHDLHISDYHDGENLDIDQYYDINISLGTVKINAANSKQQLRLPFDF